MLAARALTRQKNQNLNEDADEIVSEFRKHLFDTQLFFDPFVGGLSIVLAVIAVVGVAYLLVAQPQNRQPAQALSRTAVPTGPRA